MNEGGKETCRLYFICRNFILQSVALGKGKFVKKFFGMDKREELKNGN